MLRAFAIAVGVQLLLLPLLIAAGVAPLELGRRARRAGAGAGGRAGRRLVFGAGMALAGGCVTGMLWKAGEGAVALAHRDRRLRGRRAADPRTRRAA